MGEVKVKKDRVTRHGWEVVEKYISVQKGYNYAKAESFPVVVIDEERKKASVELK